MKTLTLDEKIRILMQGKPVFGLASTGHERIWIYDSQGTLHWTDPRNNRDYISKNHYDFQTSKFGLTVFLDWFEDTDQTVTIVKKETKCTCDFYTILLRSGCQCGGQ